MLIVVLSGRGIYSLENRETSLHGGMVGLFVPERPGVLMADPDKPYRLLYCRFGGHYARYMVDLILAQGKAPFFAWPAVRELAGMIRGMGYVKRANLPEAMGIPEVLLAECLVSLCGAPARLH